MIKTKPLIWIACGGTGGHFMPGVVMGKALEQQGFVVQYFGEGKPIEAHLCQAQDISMIRPPQGNRWSRLLWMLKILSQQSQPQRPTAILVFGGFSSFALGLWSIFSRCPLYLFEQNAIPGRVNRYLSRFAKGAFLTFPLQRSYTLKTQQWITGNPVRSLQANASKIDFDLLVIGGSQGARSLNRDLPLFYPKNWRILHVCGPGRKQEVAKATEHLELKGLEIIESHPNIPSLIQRARWVVSRAGATSLSEIAAVGCALITVPLPTSKDDHQRANADVLKQTKAALVLEETDIRGETLNAWWNDETLMAQCRENLSKTSIADIDGQKSIAILLDQLKVSP